MKNRKIHWPLLVGVTAIMLVMLLLVVVLRAEVFVVILPIAAIGFVTYILYVFLLSLGYGDKAEEKETKNEQSEA
jgi:L-asparagine transporter-like permease